MCLFQNELFLILIWNERKMCWACESLANFLDCVLDVILDCLQRVIHN